MGSSDVRLDLRSEIPVVAACGEIDESRIDAFKAALSRADAQAAAGVVVSLDEATYLCVRAFGVLAVVGSRLARDRRSLVIVCPEDHFYCRLLGLLDIPCRLARSVADALAESGAPSPPRLVPELG